MKPVATIQACYRKAASGRALEKRVSSIIFNVYQSTGIEKDNDSRQYFEKHAKIDETGSSLTGKQEKQEKPSLGLLLEEGPEVICVPRSEK